MIFNIRIQIKHKIINIEKYSRLLFGCEAIHSKSQISKKVLLQKHRN